MKVAYRGIAGLLATGTGPASLRARLRVETRAVRGALRGSNTVSALECRLPAELFGAELLEILSDRLRALLGHRGAAAQPDSAGVGSAAGAAARRGAQGATDTTVVGAVRRPRPEWPAGGAGNDGRARVDETSGRSADGDEPDPTARDSGTAETAAWERSRSPDRTPRPPQPFATAIPAAGPPIAPPVIVRKLRAYWQLSRADRSGRRSEVAQVRPPSAAGEGVATQERAGTRRGMAPEQIASQMLSFVSGPLPYSPLTRPGGAPVQAETGSAEHGPKPPPAFAAEPRWSSPRADLAEKIADVLREQAIQHGIDIS